MPKELIKQIVNKFRQLGVVWGVEFLLPPKIMIEFIENLSNAGVLIYGCDLWRFLDPNKDSTRIVALVGAGMLVEDPNPPEILTPEMSANQVKDFIINHLPEDAELVSLIFMDSEIYDLFRSHTPRLDKI